MSNRKNPDFTLCKELGIPRFINASEYPNNISQLLRDHIPEFLSYYNLSEVISWAWRWEFMRRTSAYRKYWKRYHKKCAKAVFFHNDFHFLGELPDPTMCFYEINNKISIASQIEGGYFRFQESVQRSFIVDLSRPIHKKMFDDFYAQAKAQQKALIKANKDVPDGTSKRIIDPDLTKFKARKGSYIEYLRAIDGQDVGAVAGRIAYALDKAADATSAESHDRGAKLCASARKCQLIVSGVSNLEKAWYEPIPFDR